MLPMGKQRSRRMHARFLSSVIREIYCKPLKKRIRLDNPAKRNNQYMELKGEIPIHKYRLTTRGYILHNGLWYVPRTIEAKILAFAKGTPVSKW